MREIAQLKSDPPEGIRVVTEEENVLNLVGIIAGPGVPLCPMPLRVWLTDHATLAVVKQKTRRTRAGTSGSSSASRMSSPQHRQSVRLVQRDRCCDVTNALLGGCFRLVRD